MLTVVVGVVTFTLIMLALVLALILAKARLAGGGAVEVQINDDAEHPLTVPTGGTLLSALGEHGIFVPSACGGKGTCGACKLVVTLGGGSILPTETSLVRRKEAREGVRLACQVKVRENMSIKLPESVLGVRSVECVVRSNRNVATFIKELVLELPPSEELHYEAGAYMQVHVPPHTVRYADFDIPDRYRGDWERYNLLRLISTVGASEELHRAYSLATHPGEAGRLMFNVRIATPPPGVAGALPGKASSYLFSLRPGDRVQISGPYGDFRAQETDAEMIFIGGGAGMAPLRSIVFDQLLQRKSQRTISYWYGARSLREAFYVDEFEALANEYPNFTWRLALSSPLPEDHFTGDVGNIHSVLFERYLKHHPAPEDVEYYLCGPPMMLRAVLDMLAKLGVPPSNIRYDEF